MNAMTQRVLLDLGLASCLVSFGWGMRKLFVLPYRKTIGMRITSSTGSVVAGLQFWVIQSFPIFVPFRVYFALAIYSASFLLFWWAVFVTGRKRLPACFTSIEPLTLVTAGPYRFIRHPFYTAYLLAWSAGAVASSNPLLIGSLVGMVALYVRAAWGEEKSLLSGIHSLVYHSYCNRTGMFIPLLSRKRTMSITGVQWPSLSIRTTASRPAGAAKVYLAILLAISSVAILAPTIYIVVEAIEALPGLLFSQDRLPDYRPIN
jgi:protein-S-isoprenylcysteine O-methyltransferase Ste14